MAPETEVVQYWVRSGKGTIWGPISFATVELFVDNQVISGRVQVSHDGVNFADPGRFLDIRDAFPEEMWGSRTEPAPPASLPAGLPPLAPPPASAPGASRARPVLASAGPPTLGPSALRPPPLAGERAPGVGPPTLTASPPGPQGLSPSGPPELEPAGPPRVSPLQGSAPPAAAPPKPATAPTAAVPAPKPAPRAPEPSAALEDVPAEGTLSEELSTLRLYYLLASQGATGKLTVRAPTATYELMFRKGVPHVVRSDQPPDSILMYFGEKGLIKAEGVAKAEQAAGQFGGDAVAAAFAQGLISNPGDAVAAITAHGQQMLKKVLLEPEGTVSYEADAAPPASSMALGQKWQLISQACRSMPVELARSRLGERMDMPVMKATGRVPLADLALNAQEARVASAFEGVKTVRELAESTSGVDEGVVIRACYFLGEVDLASFAAVKKRAPEPPPPPEPPRPEPPPTAPAKPAGPPGGASAKVKSSPGAKVPQAGKPPSSPGSRPGSPPSLAPGAAPAKKPQAPAPPQVDTNSLDILRKISAELVEQSHFEALGIAQTATGAQVRAAFLQKVKLFHPDSTPPDAPDGVKQLKEGILTRINEANAVLADDATRAAYVQDLKDGIAGDEKVDVAAIFKAEDLFLKATIMIKARKIAEGLKMVEEAIALNAADGEFFAWRGYAQFMVASERREAYPVAMAEIDKALKMSPRCASAAYLAGLMAKVVEDPKSALRWFKMALEIDPNYSDAARELKALR